MKKNGDIRHAINFCSNDYLGLSVNEEIFPSITSTINQSGLGSGGTRNISGTTNHHLALEETLRNWHRKEAALIFGSAYLANLTSLQTIGRHIPDLVFISDEKIMPRLLKECGQPEIKDSFSATMMLRTLKASLSRYLQNNPN